MDLSPLNRLNVLIIDDDENMRTLLGRILHRAGVSHVSLAPDGQTGLECLQQADCALNFVLCDWNMPRMSGLEFFMQVKASGSNVPVLMITGRDDVASVLSARNAGIPAYIIKPVTPQELLSKILHLVAHPPTAGRTEATSR